MADERKLKEQPSINKDYYYYYYYYYLVFGSRFIRCLWKSCTHYDFPADKTYGPKAALMSATLAQHQPNIG